MDEIVQGEHSKERELKREHWHLQFCFGCCFVLVVALFWLLFCFGCCFILVVVLFWFFLFCVFSVHQALMSLVLSGLQKWSGLNFILFKKWLILSQLLEPAWHVLSEMPAVVQGGLVTKKSVNPFPPQSLSECGSCPGLARGNGPKQLQTQQGRAGRNPAWAWLSAGSRLKKGKYSSEILSADRRSLIKKSTEQSQCSSQGISFLSPGTLCGHRGSCRYFICLLSVLLLMKQLAKPRFS